MLINITRLYSFKFWVIFYPWMFPIFSVNTLIDIPRCKGPVFLFIYCMCVNVNVFVLCGREGHLVSWSFFFFLSFSFDAGFLTKPRSNSFRWTGLLSHTIGPLVYASHNAWITGMCDCVCLFHMGPGMKIKFS